MNKTASVIINTHKGADCIAGAVESVIRQDYPEIEIIVVDDNGLGSENQQATEAALREYIDNNRIIYLPNRENMGDPRSKNAGLAVSEGDYISFLDDDDEYPDTSKLTRSIEALEGTDESWGAAYSGIEVRFADCAYTYNTGNMPSGDILRDLLIHSIYINPSNVVIKREAIESVGGYDDTYKRHVDWGFHAMLADRYKFVYVPVIGGVHNDQKPRHVQFDYEKRLGHLEYYLKRTSRFTEKYSLLDRKVIYCLNLMMLFTIKRSSYGVCARYMKKWGQPLTPAAYIRSALTYLKIKHNKFYK